MKKRIFLTTIFVLIILTLISFIFDKQISVFFENIRNYPLDFIFIALTFTTNVFIIFFFLTTLFLWKEHKRRWILPLIFSLLLSLTLTYFLKLIVHRPRPFQDGIVTVSSLAFYFLKNNFNTWNFSFPSLEAVLVFSALPILCKEFKKFKFIWLFFACLVALSRVYFGVHYISDVLVGSIIGISIGYFAVFIEEKYNLGLKLVKKLKISS
jgi:undecaprenyl-diphosphatase